ncbi:hypothetical protein [Luteimonas sp. MHLX1A]|uniref:hypothetical protein n=1 Tax=Alterluteimonas muca TaxID=2878684 RepID=UPI001E469B9D|nr:hypothetical protein [Luteimonas sp. MHLX1A]MCD9046749.1 hypothetical protein [Luteimonas sp. MHLX1A]
MKKKPPYGRSWIHPRTLAVLRQELNAYLVFPFKHARTFLVFVTILVTSYVSSELSEVLSSSDTHRAMAWMLEGLSMLLLLVDVLFVSSMVVPWVPAVKKWIARNQR